MPQPLQAGKTYKQEEMLGLLGIPRSTFYRRKEEILKKLSEYYEFEVNEGGRTTLYKVVNVLGEYDPIAHKRSRAVSSPVLDGYMIDTLRKEPYQTVLNLARLAYHGHGEEDFEMREDIKGLKIAESTAQSYMYPRMKNLFGEEVHEGGTAGEIEEKVWCRLIEGENRYEVVSQEHGYVFQRMLREEKMDVSDAYIDWYSGNRSCRDASKSVWKKGEDWFMRASNRFFDEYGYRIMRVPRYKVR